MTRDEIIHEAKEEGGMFLVIPSVVQLDMELPLSAKALYGIVTWKCNSRAYTWATNRELGEALGVSPKRAGALLSLLEERGHIETEIEYRDGTREVMHRYIYPVMKSARGIVHPTPPPENAEVICNIKKEIKNNTPYSPPAGDSAPAEPASKDKPKPNRRRFVPPDIEQVAAYCRERGNDIDPETFVDHYAAKGWMVGRSPMKDWKAAVRTWEQRRRAERRSEQQGGSGQTRYWADDPEVPS